MVLLMYYQIVHLLFIGALGCVFSKNMVNVAVAGLCYFVVYGMTLSYFLLCSERPTKQS